MLESQFNKKFRAKLNEFGFVFYRVESHGTSPGIPDNHYIHRSGSSGWIEMKSCMMVPNRVPYRTQQPGWLAMYAKAGGVCWTAMYVERDDALWIIQGKDSLAAARGLAGCPNIRVIALGKDGAWGEVASVLLGSYGSGRGSGRIG